MPASPTHHPYRRLIRHTVLVAALLGSPASAKAQDPNPSLNTISGAAKIWEDRGPIQDLDLYWANGGPDRVPVGPFTFVAEDLGGTNPKANIRDARGVLWGVKWDEEKQAEIAASRLAWAMGLRVDETYYLQAAAVVFPGGRRPPFQRIGQYIDSGGNFTSPARFKRWIPEQKTLGEWRFDENPFAADDGYAVLLLMDVIMANWDAKDSNTRIVTVPVSARWAGPRRTPSTA
jgi:hypothetical protein